MSISLAVSILSLSLTISGRCNRTFIFAAMDTTSNALSMALSLIAKHPDVQEKLRKEILEASNGEDLDYDTLVSLPYLDAVCRETLRL